MSRRPLFVQMPSEVDTTRSSLSDKNANFASLLSIFGTIKTHDSESQGQEEAGRTRQMSVLFTGSTAMKFVNALNKPP